MRAGDRSLPPDGHVRKRPLEQRGELFVGQLMPMERVDLTGGVAVEPAIGRGDDQHAVVGQHARHLGEHPPLLVHVLDHLERNDGPERAVLELGEIERVAHLERRPRPAPVQLGVLDGARVDVDADDLGPLAAGQDRRSEALAAAQIQHATARDDRCRPQIAMRIAGRRPAHPASRGRTALRSNRSGEEPLRGGANSLRDSIAGYPRR